MHTHITSNGIHFQLEPAHDTRTAAVRIENERYFIPHEDADPMEPHLAREVRENLYTAIKVYSKEGIREGLGDYAENLLRVFRAYHLIVAVFESGSVILAEISVRRQPPSSSVTFTFTRPGSLGSSALHTG